MIKINRFFKTYQGLPRSVYVIFFAQVINRFGDFVMPFLTLLLTTQFHYSVAQTGSIVMLTMILSIPGGLIGGKVADHIGRKKSYLIFQGASGLSLMLCAFFYTHQVMLLFIFMSSFFSGAVRPILSAILSDVLKPEDRQAGFSLSYLGINLGVALGPIVAGFLFNHFRFWIFMGDAITSFFAVALVILTIKESLPRLDEEHHSNDEQAQAHALIENDSQNSLSNMNEHEKTMEGSILDVLKKRPQLILFMLFNLFFSATYVQSGFSLPLILNHLYAERGPQIFGSLMSTNAISVLVFTMVITAFSKRNSAITNIAIGGIAYVIGFGMIGLIKTLPLFFISTLIWTLGEIIMSINFGVYITSQTPANFRARFNAITNMSFAIGAILGTAIIGIYIDHFSITMAWPLIAVSSAIGTGGMFYLSFKDIRGLKK